MRVLLSVADAVGDLLADQVNHGGADAVQMFDTWAGLLSESDYRNMLNLQLNEPLRYFGASRTARSPYPLCERKFTPPP